MLIQREALGRVPSAAVVPPPGRAQASPSFDGFDATQPPGNRRFFRPLLGAPPFDARSAGAQPLTGQSWQTPSGNLGAGAGRGGH